MGRKIFTYMFFIMFLVWAAPTEASKCDDHGVLQDSDHYAAKWRWGAPNDRPIIHIWDSPALVVIVGNVNPGAYVEIVDEKDGFYKIRTQKEHGGITGWVRKEQVATLLPRAGVQPHECFAGLP